MQKSPGTGKLGVSYPYYACGNRVRKGRNECHGVRIRMDYLDDEVIRVASTELCTRDRLAEMLGALHQHLSVNSVKVSTHLVTAEKELRGWDDRLQRLHRSIEDGLVPLDEVLRDRIFEISGKRETAKKLVERLRKQVMPQQDIDQEKIEAFSRVFQERLKDGNPILRRNYLKSVIGAVVVEPSRIRIVGGQKPSRRERRRFFICLEKSSHIRVPFPREG